MDRIEFDVASLTDIGLKRANNEDSFGVFPRDGNVREVLIVLADGMGGASAGEVASRLAVETVRRLIENSSSDLSAGERLRAAIVEANGTVFRKASANSEMSGMGTTCTAALAGNGFLAIGHVGDSRAYLVRSGKIEQLTEDHSLAAEAEKMADDGEAPSWIPRNLLTRSVGVGESVEVDVIDLPGGLGEGDAIVLCSDGLSNMVEPGEILDAVGGASGGDVPSICRKLVDLALERGGPDNITVQVAVARRAS